MPPHPAGHDRPASASSSPRTSVAWSRVAGRSPYCTASKTAAVRSTGRGRQGARSRPAPPRGRSRRAGRPASRVRPGGPPAPEALDDRVRVAGAASACSARAAGPQRSGPRRRTRPRGRAAREAVRRARLSSQPSPSATRRNATIAANAESGGEPDAASTVPLTNRSSQSSTRRGRRDGGTSGTSSRSSSPRASSGEGSSGGWLTRCRPAPSARRRTPPCASAGRGTAASSPRR